MRIRLEEVSHVYAGSDESAAVQVLDRVSLDIPSGDFAVLRGASGSGKSTLLHLIGAVDRPSGGKIHLDDVETSALDEDGLTNIRRRHLGFVFQFFNLIPTLTVAENVAFPLALLRLPPREAEERARAVIGEVGLWHRQSHYPNELSGGEMQRVAIARAVVHGPSLLIADEPTGNLDSRNGTAVLELIRNIHEKSGSTIVMATHSDGAARYGDYAIHVVDGRVERG